MQVTTWERQAIGGLTGLLSDKVSRSSLYYSPVGVRAKTLKLMDEIDRVFTKYPFFNSRLFAGDFPGNGNPCRPSSCMSPKGSHGAIARS